MDEDEDDTDTEYSGTSESYHEPVITKRDDIRILGKILDDSAALKKLTETRNLNRAFSSSDLVFQEKIENAIESVENDVRTLGRLSIPPEQAPKIQTALNKLRLIVDKTRSSSLQGVEQTDVFHDRIDQHFSHLKIEAYRSLNGLEVKKISRNNIIAGLNNSGKTSFLEALYLLCKQNDFNGLIDILRRRGKIPENHVSPKWLVEQLTEEIVINGVFDKQESSVRIRSSDEVNSSIDRTQYLKSIEISSRFENKKLESITRIYEGQPRETEAETIKILSNVVFSSPFFLNEPHNHTAFYYKAVKSKLLPRILKFIQEKFISTVTDIRLVDEFQRFLVDDSLFGYSMDLTSYGEGLQRVFFTSLLFASAENGVVLIDEFENALHANLIETFASFVQSLSKEFNVQVFLTSHSKECIDSFVRTIPKEDMTDFAFHALVRSDDGKVSSREFEGPEFSKLLEAGNVDLRKAR